MPEVPGDLMRIGDAAREIDRSVVTLRDWVRSGRVHGYRRAGKALYVSLSEVQAYDQPRPIEPAKSSEK